MDDISLKLAALKLVEQGKISFDTPLADYLPELRQLVIVEPDSETTVARPAETPLTLTHLLNFSSGLFYSGLRRKSPNALAFGYTDKEVHTLEDPISGFLQIIIVNLPGVPLKFEPGTDFVYGWSSDILGFIVEKVSQKSLEDFCKEHIFGPLGMSSSFYLRPDLKKDLVNLTYTSAGDGKLYPWADQMEIMEQSPDKLHLHLGGVGMYSSTRDYLKLLRHMLQIHAGHDTTVAPIWKLETIRQIFVPALTEKGSKSISDMVAQPGTQWGTAMAIATVDKPKGKKKGSAFWGGYAGTYHFIDPTTGIVVMFGMQLTPPRGPDLLDLYPKLEELIYAAVEVTDNA
ncbi:hypothetical protein HYPSUDRAFT_135104 [Hypholoma sublateritium FD-334 SS-4]|uniref:Beta-lactamase-related domain-containing protein n=1 Tax=Hypholoma sublateritium (strain FD-334 SS-4) TaxID=945553 RepID=A0A0D2Q160_HYPSF|nr:hypothetical protein HYPSUDRAFT_135104 [Hypholoma sublateritium FD-334 SS-4]